MIRVNGWEKQNIWVSDNKDEKTNCLEDFEIKKKPNDFSS